jgi:hypothetical protein
MGQAFCLTIDALRAHPCLEPATLCDSRLATSAFVDFFDVDTTRALDPATAEEVADMPIAEQMAVLSQLCEGAISSVFFQQIVATPSSECP